MAREALVIGKTGVGKTALVLALAEFLNLKQVEFSFLYPDGSKRVEVLRLEQARRKLIGNRPHRTRCLQSISINLPAGKGKRTLVVTDTTGLLEGIHEQPEIRRAMAQSLEAVRRADIVLHVLDVRTDGAAAAATGELDQQLAGYASLKSGYALIVNKMDLPGAEAGLARIKERFVGRRIIPVSASQKKGLAEVKAFLWQHA